MVPEKLKTSSVLMLNFKLKIKERHWHLRFMLTILIHTDSAFEYTP